MSQRDALEPPQGALSNAQEPHKGPAQPPHVREFCPLLLIGQGGMGTVEVALERSQDALGRIDERIVALKRLTAEALGNDRYREMFLREAHLATRLSHKNVVRGLASGEREGEPFLAMEYVEGEPLSRVLAAIRKTGGALPPAIVAYALAEACDGLHEAHELAREDGQPLNVVHRDVSPHNIMFSFAGDIKLLDFGVAKFDAAGHKTRTGEVKGKMAYMSPEQAMGDPLDRRSDLYAVGSILFESLVGRRMWGEGTDVDMMRRLALEEPPRLTLGPPPLSLLEDLYQRLVARDPESRPATAHAVAAELRAFVEASGSVVGQASLAHLMNQLFPGAALRRRHELRQRLAALGRPEVTGPLPSSVPPPAETSATFSIRTGRKQIALVALAAALLGSLGALAWFSGRTPAAVIESAAREPVAAAPAAPPVESVVVPRAAEPTGVEPSQGKVTADLPPGPARTASPPSPAMPPLSTRRKPSTRVGSTVPPPSPPPPPPPKARPSPPDVDPTPF